MRREYASWLKQLVIFAGLYEDETFSKFNRMAQASVQQDSEAAAAAAADFTASLYRHETQNWSEYLRDLVLTLDTCLARAAAARQEIPKIMLDAAMRELELLSLCSSMSVKEFTGSPFAAGWLTMPVDLQGEYLNRVMEIEQYGYGPFAKARMFRLDGQKDGVLQIRPVLHPDPIRMDQLYEYRLQHEAVLENTRALFERRPASNILLYGDAGCGKSACVKAVANEFADQGLRLIEVSKQSLSLMPDLLDLLSSQPLKFILFIDDLSFMENDDEFSALKAVLEGSASARSSNTVIYATSNRRHLVKESSRDRMGDDLFRNDAMQETISLSDRFGLRILFEKPKAQTYRELVLAIARENHLDMDPEELMSQAEEYALTKGGRSARGARQFVELMLSRKGTENESR